MDNQNTQQNNIGMEEFATSAAPQSGFQPISPQSASAANPLGPTTDANSPDVDKILQNMSNEEILRAFAEGLLIEKGLGEMEPEVKEEMVEDLLERINAFIDRAALESLPAEKLEELDQMIDGNTATEENVAELIKNFGVNTDEMVAKALEKFRDVYLGQVQESEE